MRSHARRALAVGTALAVLTALACLAFAAARDPEPLSLEAVSRRALVDNVLMMSCADSVGSDAGSSPVSGDALWCSDSSAPHCIPTAPPVPRPELWDSHDSCALHSFETPTRSWVLLPSWSRPEATSLHARLSASRLERPPRA